MFACSPTAGESVLVMWFHANSQCRGDSVCSCWEHNMEADPDRHPASTQHWRKPTLNIWIKQREQKRATLSGVLTNYWKVYNKCSTICMTQCSCKCIVFIITICTLVKLSDMWPPPLSLTGLHSSLWVLFLLSVLCSHLLTTLIWSTNL